MYIFNASEDFDVGRLKVQKNKYNICEPERVIGVYWSERDFPFERWWCCTKFSSSHKHSTCFWSLSRLDFSILPCKPTSGSKIEFINTEFSLERSVLINCEARHRLNCFKVCYSNDVCRISISAFLGEKGKKCWLYTSRVNRLHLDWDLNWYNLFYCFPITVNVIL